jgi:hypothetical protein
MQVKTALTLTHMLNSSFTLITPLEKKQEEKTILLLSVIHVIKI